MKNMKNVGSFATARLQAKMRSTLAIALAAVTAFSMAACKDDSGNGGDDGDGGGGYWLIYEQQSYPVNGVQTYTRYSWTAYRYTSETDYEEEYTTYSTSGYGDDDETQHNSTTYSEHHYTRNGQTSYSNTETISHNSRWQYDGNHATNSVSSGTNSTTSSYDLASGFTSSSTTVSSGTTSSTFNLVDGTISKTTSPGATNGTIYSIELLSDTGVVKTYKYSVVGSEAYSIYKIQEGRTLEVSYYDANNILIYTTTYTRPDNAEIRARLPNFTLYSTVYHSSSYSINSSHQTIDSYYCDDDNNYLSIRVSTFNDGVLSSQTDNRYFKMKFNVNSGGDIPTYGGNPKYGDYEYKEENGEITITRYTRLGGYANIPAQINGKPVTVIGDHAFNSCYKLTGVTIPNSVTRIWGHAFRDCWSLPSVNIPDSITSIGSGAFSGCYSLTGEITIPNTVTSIGDRAFSASIINITWYYNPSIQMRIGWDDLISEEYDVSENLFWIFNRNLKTVIIPNSVTSIRDNAFYDYESLTSVTFQGTIDSENFSYSFNGDLREKYLAGGPGTYTREANGYYWTKQE